MLNNLNSERMKDAIEYLFENGYTEKVKYPDGKEESTCFQYETVVRLMNEFATKQVNGVEQSESTCNLQSVKASVLSDINKMIEKVEGWIDKDTSRRDKYLIHGQADGMRKAIHIIHQHLP